MVSVKKGRRGIMEEIVKKAPQELKEFQPLFNLICLSKYPFFVRASGKDKRRNLTYETQENGNKISWSIASTSFLPGEPEYKVWIWLCDKVMKKKKKTGEVPKYIDYSLYEIAKYWNLSPEGRNIKFLQDALENLVHTTITSSLTDTNGKKEGITFHLVDRILGKGSETEEGGVLTRGLIQISDTTGNMFEQGLLKPNGMETLKSLTDENIVASNLYQLLSYYYFLTKKDTIDFWYNDLAEKLGLIPQKALARIEQQFERIKDALKVSGVIRDLEFQKILDQQDPKKKNIRCRFFIGETIKEEIKEFMKKADHQKLVEKVVENKESRIVDGEELEREVKYWLEEIEQGIKEKVDELKYLIQKIITTNKNYNDLLYRAISETKVYQPENKKAYLIWLLQKFSSEYPKNTTL